MFSITIASFADVNILNQSATNWQDEGVVTSQWGQPQTSGRAELLCEFWCMWWWRHVCHLHTSHVTLCWQTHMHSTILSCQSMLLLQAQKLLHRLVVPKWAPEAVSVLSASLFSADRTAPYHSACPAQVWLSCSNVLKASTQATDYSSTNSTMWRAGLPNIIFWFGNVTPKETDNGVGKKKPWDFCRLISPL